MRLISRIVLKKNMCETFGNAHAKYGGDCFSSSKIFEKIAPPQIFECLKYNGSHWASCYTSYPIMEKNM